MSVWQVVGLVGLVAGFGGSVFYGVHAQRVEEDQRVHEATYGTCHDQSWLLATTAGSPDSARCPNVHQRMRVQVATTASHEEVGALVFCECQ